MSSLEVQEYSISALASVGGGALLVSVMNDDGVMVGERLCYL